jgi:Skp family chaperone for outer membrane proteins
MSGLLSFSYLPAQQPSAPQAQAAGGTSGGAATSRTVGVIDVGHILQNHPTLKGKMESIKSAMEAADKEMQAKREAIIKQMEQLKEKYNEGTPEYDRAEKAIADQDTQFRLELVKKRKEFEAAQAVVLYEVHTQISQLLDYVSKNHGFQVILQVSRQTVDPKKPETLDMAMSQNVLYFNKSTDVTDWVLSALQQQLGGSGVPASTQQPAQRAASGAPLGINR